MGRDDKLESVGEDGSYESKPTGENKQVRKKKKRVQRVSRPVKPIDAGASLQQWQPRECYQNAMCT